MRLATRGRRELPDKTGAALGHFAGSFEPPLGTRCRSAEVWAVTGWSREASKPEYHDSVKCDEWEVVVPELVFEPDRGATSVST